MIAALLGLSGVLVGATLTQLFASSSEWRNRRLSAMVSITVACGRVIGAHERLHELFRGNNVPPPTDSRAVGALIERINAHNDWRNARAQVEILIADDWRLREAMDHFQEHRSQASTWVSAYLQNEDTFRYDEFREVDNRSWRGMRAARHEVMTCSQARSKLDSRWYGLLRLRFSLHKINYDQPRLDDRYNYIHDHSAE